MNNFYESNKYKNLNQSSLTPPNYVFGPVWALLYTLMLSSTYIIYTKCKTICFPIYIFFVHLFFNFLWSYLFTKIENKVYALVDIYIMISLTILYMNLYKKIDLNAFKMNIPYLLWILFASYLNLYIVVYN